MLNEGLQQSNKMVGCCAHLCCSRAWMSCPCLHAVQRARATARPVTDHASTWQIKVSPAQHPACLRGALHACMCACKSRRCLTKWRCRASRPQSLALRDIQVTSSHCYGARPSSMILAPTCRCRATARAAANHPLTLLIQPPPTPYAPVLFQWRAAVHSAR